MISNELIEEVIYESSKGNFISKGLVLRIALNIVENLNYVSKSKLQEVRFVDLSGEFGLATCDRTTGIIEADYNALINQEKENKVYSCLKSNINIIQYICHEIEHLNEFYKEGKYNLESRLIGISSGVFVNAVISNLANKLNIKEENKIDFINNKFESFQETYWKILPMEKIAEVDSYKNLLNSFKKYPNFISKYPKLYHYLVDEYIDSYKIGYVYDEKLNVPLFDYLKALKTIDCNITLSDLGITLKQSKSEKNLTSLDKFKYGLPITKNNIKELNKEKLLLKNIK